MNFKLYVIDSQINRVNTQVFSALRMYTNCQNNQTVYRKYQNIKLYTICGTAFLCRPQKM